jgi:RNA polymerase sigma factor (sigma-70 family)
LTKPAGDDPVRQYLNEIGRYPLLTKADEVALAQAIEVGREAAEKLNAVSLTVAKRCELRGLVREGEVAKDRFIASNLRLVVKMAKQYQSSRHDLELLDVIQEGNCGLMRAVEKFDHRKGFKFSTYATWWIRQAITRGIGNTGRTIRLPIHVIDRLANIKRARADLADVLGRAPRVEELAGELDLPLESVVEALRVQDQPRSLDERLSDDDGAGDLGDLVADPNAENPIEVAVASVLPYEIARLLSVLDEDEREVLRLRHGLDHGDPRRLDEVAEQTSLSQDRVRNIESRAISKLRHPASGIDARELLSA